MRLQVGDVKLFFDVEGAKLRPAGESMREIPTVLLHGVPGFDHSEFKVGSSQLAEIADSIPRSSWQWSERIGR
jgi:hypothetical protein